ncbi:MAG: IPExxxVDY family protein [Flavobacteriales bacterium]|nr:IPExxxVDY family protein [Flavobacteriales bacterium]
MIRKFSIEEEEDNEFHVIFINTHFIEPHKFAYLINQEFNIHLTQIKNHKVKEKNEEFEFIHYKSTKNFIEYPIELIRNISIPKEINTSNNLLFSEIPVINYLIPQKKTFSYIIKYIYPISNNFYLFLRSSKFVIGFEDIKSSELRNYKKLI